MFDYNFKLVKVVDGDTVDVDIDLGFGIWIRNERIRMMGIDTHLNQELVILKKRNMD